jgi:hypothetical protein
MHSPISLQDFLCFVLDFFFKSVEVSEQCSDRLLACARGRVLSHACVVMRRRRLREGALEGAWQRRGGGLASTAAFERALGGALMGERLDRTGRRLRQEMGRPMKGVRDEHKHRQVSATSALPAPCVSVPFRYVLLRC